MQNKYLKGKNQMQNEYSPSELLCMYGLQRNNCILGQPSLFECMYA